MEKMSNQMRNLNRKISYSMEEKQTGKTNPE